MSNYIEYNNKIAFHPGYYIKEIVEESGLTQADFARKLDTTPKNLSVLINGEQSLSIEMATKLSRMLGTTVKFWLNLQQSYDLIKTEIISDKMYEEEKRTYKNINYDFWVEHYDLVDADKDEERIKRLREYLKISSLKVLQEKDLIVDFRGYEENLSQKEIINTNAIIQTAVNRTPENDMPDYNRKKFIRTIDYIVNNSITEEEEVKKVFNLSGVNLIFVPCMKNAKMNAFSKKLDGKVCLAINKKWQKHRKFWEILFQEAGHIVNNEFGVMFRGNCADVETKANKYALSKLMKL